MSKTPKRKPAAKPLIGKNNYVVVTAAGDNVALSADTVEASAGGALFFLTANVTTYGWSATGYLSFTKV